MKKNYFQAKKKIDFVNFIRFVWKFGWTYFCESISQTFLLSKVKINMYATPRKKFFTLTTYGKNVRYLRNEWDTFNLRGFYSLTIMFIKSMSKVCVDESLVASSHTYNERFSSGFSEMRERFLQIIILQEYLWKKWRKTVNNEEENEEENEGKKNWYRFKSS